MSFIWILAFLGSRGLLVVLVVYLDFFVAFPVYLRTYFGICKYIYKMYILYREHNVKG